MTRHLVVITAGLSQPSSTRLLADRLTAAVRQQVIDSNVDKSGSGGDSGSDVDLRVIELRDLAGDIAQNMVTGFPGPQLRDVLAAPTPHGTIVVVHHPPTPASSALLAVLELRHPGMLLDACAAGDVRLILGGHYHHARVAIERGIPVAVAPGVANASDPYAPAGHEPTLAVVDASFISLGKIMPAIAALLHAPGELIALIKPQFEAGREAVGKRGVVRDPAVHRHVIEGAIAAARSSGWELRGLTYSPIKGPEGNIEFLGYWGREASDSLATEVAGVVEEAHRALKESE